MEAHGKCRLWGTAGMVAFALAACESWPRDISIPAGFAIELINNSGERVSEFTCTYPEGSAGGGITDPDYSDMEHAYPPKSGPIRVHWNTPNGAHYQVQFPFREEYVVRPDGLLVIRIRRDHTVSVLGIARADLLKKPWYAQGDVFQAVETDSTSTQKVLPK